MSEFNHDAAPTWEDNCGRTKAEWCMLHGELLSAQFQLAALTADLQAARAAVKECLAVVDDCYAATGHCKVATSSYQRERLLAAIGEPPIVDTQAAARRDAAKDESDAG